jgi:hypothetical protein
MSSHIEEYIEGALEILKVTLAVIPSMIAIRSISAVTVVMMSSNWCKAKVRRCVMEASRFHTVG